MPKHLFRSNIFGSSSSLESISENNISQDDKAVVVNHNGSYFYRLVDYTGRFEVPDDNGVFVVSPLDGTGIKKWLLISSEPVTLGGKGLREDPPNTGANSFSIWLTTNIS